MLPFANNLWMNRGFALNLNRTQIYHPFSRKPFIIECFIAYFRTVIDLKSRLERLTNIPAAKMKLFYVDQDYAAPEEMKYMHKQLYSYNIRDGDEIIIDQKR